MTTRDERPFLYFDFANSDGKVQPLTFTNPVKTIVAWTIEDVAVGIELVQKKVDQGFYAAGYIAYEAAPAFNENLPVNEGNTMPLLWFGIFNEPMTAPIKSKQPFNFTQWQPSVSLQEYNQNVEKILSYINKGITKQVNYTIQMETQFEGDSFSFYKQLAKAQAADYTAYLNIGDFSILSASPELFFRLKDGIITTKPMKGTANRALTYEEDIKNAEWLRNSAKNKRENKMIVQLMQQDLEKIALKDTVAVPTLYEIEKYPTVYQMTSTVTAQISDETSIPDIFSALFPCGSITGSPKQATMEIIQTLETPPREVYCGTIGYITPEKEAVFNVPIRTVSINNKSGKALYGVGGAITGESTKEEEYAEVLTKTKLLTREESDFQLFETMKLENGQYFLLDRHVKRLQQSASFFSYPVNVHALKQKLTSNANQFRQGSYLVRLLVDEAGTVILETNRLVPNKEKNFVALAKKPIHKKHLFLYHKTTYRQVYETHQNKDLFDVLLWNEQKEVTEFTTGNIVVKLNGEYVTPPIDSGLLAGTFRASLIEDGTITEQKIHVSDLKSCEEVWFINSVREWVRVSLDR